MYKSMKTLIGKRFYENAEEAQERLDVFYLMRRLKKEEYTELAVLVREVYGGEAA